MAYQNVFRRYEIKYLLNAAQKEAVLAAIAPHMQRDKYGRTTICNLYFDTENYRLIRRSLEKPLYKEKLRLRSYGRATEDGTVFAEIKKKFKSVVYKRRIGLPNSEAMAWLCQNGPLPRDTQIGREIEAFREFYGELTPKVFLSYEREAYYMKDGSDFRVTFDENVLCRRDRLSLTEAADGDRILPEGLTLMELKCSGGIPLFLTSVLSEHKIFKASFSKYGTAYSTLIFPEVKEQKQYEFVSGNL